MRNKFQSLGRTLRESESKSKLDLAIAKVRADIVVLDGLLKEANRLGLIDLSEEAIEVKSPEDIWAENKDSVKTYIANTVYYVKKLDGGQKYEVTITDGTERKPFANLTKQALDLSFTPVRPNENPDAEGFTQYRKGGEVEAFKYTDGTIKVNSVLLAKGDYLIRSPKGDEFVYEVKKAKDFEASNTEK